MTLALLHQATLGHVPVSLVGDVVLQPGREIPYSIPHRRPRPIRRVVSGDEERYNGERREGEDDEERGEEVEVEGGVDAAQHADEAEGGDDEYEEAAEEERVLEHLLAVAVDADVGGVAHGGDTQE